MTDHSGWTLARLDWDSEFWSREVAIARPDADGPPLDAARLESSDFDLVYALCSTAAGLGRVRDAEEAGFRSVDLRCVVTTCDARAASAGTAPITSADAAALAAAAALAGSTHTNTRFANDPLLEPERVVALYRRWIERDAATPGWTVLVADDHGDVAGYVTHGPGVDGSGTIGLIGVRPESRGTGLGRALLDAAIAGEAEAGRSRLSVVTHGGDAESMAMYRSAGFAVTSLQVWLHWHRRR